MFRSKPVDSVSLVIGRPPHEYVQTQYNSHASIAEEKYNFGNESQAILTLSREEDFLRFCVLTVFDLSSYSGRWESMNLANSSAYKQHLLF